MTSPQADGVPRANPRRGAGNDRAGSAAERNSASADRSRGASGAAGRRGGRHALRRIPAPLRAAFANPARQFHRTPVVLPPQSIRRPVHREKRAHHRLRSDDRSRVGKPAASGRRTWPEVLLGHPDPFTAQGILRRICVVLARESSPRRLGRRTDEIGQRSDRRGRRASPTDRSTHLSGPSRCDDPIAQPGILRGPSATSAGGFPQEWASGRGAARGRGPLQIHQRHVRPPGRR